MSTKVENVDLYRNFKGRYTQVMESRALPVILGILMGVGALGCSSREDAREEGKEPGGGMDGGGGQILIALAWDKQVFLQPLWQDGALKVLVVNQRAAPVEVEVARYRCPDDGPIADACQEDPMQTLAQWQVPAASTATFDGTPLLVDALALSVKVDGERLGLMEKPQAPLGGEPGAFISNQGFGTYSRRELATRFSSVPGATFQAQLTLTHGGRLYVAPSAALAPNVITLTPHAARTDGVDVSGNQFFVDVPESTSEESPFQVELDFAVTADAPPGSLFVLQPGSFCVDFDAIAESCRWFVETMRVLPPP